MLQKSAYRWFLIPLLAVALAQPMGPMPIPTPSGASRVTALVVRQSVWSGAALAGGPLAVEPGARVFSLLLRVSTSSPVGQAAEAPSPSPPEEVEAFSLQPISSAWVGRRIQATLRLVGDTRSGVRWVISEIVAAR